MAKLDTYRCDSCSAIKQDSNHWLLGLTNFTIHLQRIHERDSSSDYEQAVHKATVIAPWNDELSKELNIAHLCGVACATKFVVKNLEQH